MTGWLWQLIGMFVTYILQITTTKAVFDIFYEQKLHIECARKKQNGTLKIYIYDLHI